MPASDPRLWTVDDLHTNALYRDAGYPDTQIPDAMALYTNSADNSPSVRRTGISEGVIITDEAGNKRRNITNLSTTPLSVVSGSQVSLNTATSGLLRQVDSNVNDYSDLLKWQNIAGGDQIVDLPDEDELEDEDDFGSMDIGEEDAQIHEDQHDDAVEETNKRTNLSQDEIVRIINERIEFYTNAWVPNKGVPSKERVDPKTVWNEAEAKGERERLAQHYETEYDYFSQRLNKLCDEIIKDPGSNAVSYHTFSVTPVTQTDNDPCRNKYGNDVATSRALWIAWSLRLGCAIFTNWNLSTTAKKNTYWTTNQNYDKTRQITEASQQVRLSI